jgi:hypothetical protein
MNDILPSAYTIIGTGDPIEGENQVEFRLLYEGELLASSNTKRRTSEKHAIRRFFHPQLRRLWTVNHSLRQLAIDKPIPLEFTSKMQRGPTEQERFEFGLIAIGRNWERAGYHFVPLVTSDMVLRCSLDILLLRPEEKKYIFKMGDIDGQLKTLFDGLKIPTNEDETGKSPPQSDEDPFFCLLEDDSLITEVSVKTDQLLLLPNREKIKATDSFVVIDVKLNHKDPRTFDNYFG